VAATPVEENHTLTHQEEPKPGELEEDEGYSICAGRWGASALLACVSRPLTSPSQSPYLHGNSRGEARP